MKHPKIDWTETEERILEFLKQAQAQGVEELTLKDNLIHAKFRIDIPRGTRLCGLCARPLQERVSADNKPIGWYCKICKREEP